MVEPQLEPPLLEVLRRLLRDEHLPPPIPRPRPQDRRPGVGQHEVDVERPERVVLHLKPVALRKPPDVQGREECLDDSVGRPPLEEAPGPPSDRDSAASGAPRGEEDLEEAST